jgi:hypothetical protein
MNDINVNLTARQVNALNYALLVAASEIERYQPKEAARYRAMAKQLLSAANDDKRPGHSPVCLEYSGDGRDQA